MIISGRITRDYDGLAAIGWNSYDYDSFADLMYDFAKENGIAYQHNNNLGGWRAVIPDCSISMYFSDEEMDFEKAQEKFLEQMFDASGVFEMRKDRVGYSEWTITGYDLRECVLGGHNLNDILLDHIGEYVNICVETNKYNCDYMGW